ncbi:MAG: SPFH domain-containing protein, partial [Sphaerochaetaceae bacterium]
MQIIFTVPQSHVVVITRFGKYAKTKKQGLRSRIPLFEKIHRVKDWGNTANKEGIFIELTEQNMNTKPKQCHSKDNVPVTIDASIYWRIIDVKKALFEVDNLPTAIVDTCLNALRSEIGKLTLDQILSSRQELSEKVASSLIETSGKWGVQISRVEIQELETSDETAEAM